MSDRDSDSRCYSYNGSDGVSTFSGSDTAGPSLFNLNEAENSLMEKEELERKSNAMAKLKRGLRFASTITSLPATGLPFSCRYTLPESGLFINNVQLTFSIRESPTGSISKHRMNQLRRGIQRLLNLDLSYEITFSHGIFNWSVTRKWNHWRRLYPLLRASGLLPHVIQRQRLDLGPAGVENASRLQHRHDSTTSVGLDGEDCKSSKFEEQLKKILDKLEYLDRNQNLLKFLAVSRLSFIRGIGGKGAEAEVGVYIQRYASPLKGCDFCHSLLTPKKKMWMIVKETCIIFLKDNLSEPHEVFLLDPNCFIVNGLDPSMRNYLCGFVLRNSSMLAIAQCDYTDYPMLASKMDLLKELLPNMTSSLDEEEIRKRHGSLCGFAKTRRNCPAKWYVDGATYFADIFDALEQATEEIFICDWWLTPELHLKRPDDGYHKLMSVLQRKAERGVRVYILIYKEVKYTLKIDSWYSKLMLRALCKRNIFVLRHPDHLASWEFLWAHHEKLVVVDQKLAFVGGIDLCYGRWDTQQHHLVDNGDSNWCKYPPLIPVLTSSHSPPTSRRVDFRRSAWLHKMQEVMHFDRLYSARTPRYIEILPRFQDTPENLALEADSQFASPCDTPSASPPASPPRRRRSPDAMERISEISADSGQSSGGHATNGRIFADLRKADARGRSARRLFSISNDAPHRLPPSRQTSRQVNLSVSQPASSLRHHVEFDVSEIERPVEDGAYSLVVDTPDAKRLKDGQIQVKHHDPVMQRMGNFLRSNRERRRVTRDIRERLRRDERRPASDADPKFAIRPDELEKIQMWKGKDYVNWILKEPVRLHKPEEELVDRRRVPRMPWHDIGCVVGGNAAKDVARHFIERWNFTVKNKNKRSAQLPLLIPKTLKMESSVPDNSDLEQEAAAAANEAKHQERWTLRNLFRLQGSLRSSESPAETSQEPQRPPPLPFKSIAPKFANRVTVLRSLGMWSGGIEEPETSVYDAMCDAIESAEHYLYIENQFFISNAEESLDSKLPARNRVAACLLRRILRAHEKNQLFRVFLVLPLLPQFEGDITENSSSGENIKKILHHTYECLCRSEDSLIGQLRAAGIDHTQYLAVCSLRTWGKLECGKLCTELIYVHSKLLIADDRVAIIGSANINDRSLLGYRDSELCIRFEDAGSDLTQCEWQCGKVMVGAFCSSLRRCLMREHLGVSWSDPSDQLLADPVSDRLFNDLWLARARRNTAVYEDVFHCYPTDKVANYRDFKLWTAEQSLAETNSQVALQRLEAETRGFLVEFPLKFLEDVSLDFPVGRITRASILPLITWL